jgi:hypothetical protein
LKEQEQGMSEGKINELQTLTTKKIRHIYRGIREFKKGYQPRTNVMKDENSDLLADTHTVLSRLKNSFYQPLNVHSASDVRLTEIHTAELLVPELTSSEDEVSTEKLKRYKSPGTDQILAGLIQA